MNTNFVVILAVGLLCLIGPQSASADIVSISTADVNRNGNFDVSTGSNYDWRIFDTIAGGGNSQSGGAGAISNPVFDNNGNSIIQSALGTIPTFYNWIDGMAAGTGGAVNTGGINPTDVFMRDQTGSNLSGSGASLTFTILGTGTEQTVSIYGPKRWVGESITASLPGFAAQTVNGSTPTASPTEVFKTDITFTAANSGDLLTVVLTGTGSTAGQNDQRLGVQAVTVSAVAIPEPTSLALLGVAGLGVLVRRKRSI